MAEYVRATLREGLHGWEVVDCSVTMTECAYSVAGCTCAAGEGGAS